MYFVYILFAKEFDKFYIGQTSNLQARFSRHNAGTEKASKPYRPWEITWYVVKSTRAEAMQLEKKLKNLSKIKLKEFIKKYSV